jgi:hypothetical protein
MVVKYELGDVDLNPFQRCTRGVACAHGDLQLAVFDRCLIPGWRFSEVVGNNLRFAPGVAAKHDLPIPIGDDGEISAGSNAIAGLRRND